jgi:hypothetical protein
MKPYAHPIKLAYLSSRVNTSPVFGVLEQVNRLQFEVQVNDEETIVISPPILTFFLSAFMQISSTEAIA